VASAISSAITVAGAVSDFHRFPYYLENIQALMDVLYEFSFNFFQFSKYPNIRWNRGTQSKNATSCGNDCVTNITLAQSLRRMSQNRIGILCASTKQIPDAIMPLCIIACDKAVSIIAYFFKISIFLSKFVTFSLIFFRKMCIHFIFIRIFDIETQLKIFS